MNHYIYHIARYVVAVILLQTLFFKFSGAEESIFIFSTLGVEPWGRYGSGILELIASVLLILPKFTWIGALISINVMMGAILSHIFFLGLDVKGDGGLLFGLALLVLICSVYIAYLDRKKILYINQYF